MSSFRAITLLLALFFLPTCVVNEKTGPQFEKQDTTPITYRDAGDFSRSLSHDGLERSYLLHIPVRSDVEKAIPMVVVLHGATGDAQAMVDWEAINLNEKADRMNFVVVYPDGTGDVENRSLYWNAAHCCGTAHSQGIDDIGFLRTLIETLTKDLNLDSRQIFVTGFSNGGMMSYQIAAELSDLVAAVAPVSGTIGGKSSSDGDKTIIPDPVVPVPIIIFHGALDMEVPYNGGHISAAHGRVDMSVLESAFFWILHNKCTTAPITTVGPNGLFNKEVFLPLEDSGGVPVVVYTMWQVAHEWPKTVNNSTATDIILEFFFNPDSRIL
jgi:polyhydroxybutyrate depolymerase